MLGATRLAPVRRPSREPARSMEWRALALAPPRAAGAVTVGSAQSVATVGLYGVACPGPSSCDAVGAITSDVQPLVDDEGAVVPLGLTGPGALTVVPEEPVAETVQLFGVACGTAGPFQAAGAAYSSGEEGVAATLPATQTVSLTTPASGVVSLALRLPISEVPRPVPSLSSSATSRRSAPAKLRRDIAQYRVEDMGAVVDTELIGDSQQQGVGSGDRLIVGQLFD